jgi:hypothetical protein
MEKKTGQDKKIHLITAYSLKLFQNGKLFQLANCFKMGASRNLVAIGKQILENWDSGKDFHLHV